MRKSFGFSQSKIGKVYIFGLSVAFENWAQSRCLYFSCSTFDYMKQLKTCFAKELEDLKFIIKQSIITELRASKSC